MIGRGVGYRDISMTFSPLDIPGLVSCWSLRAFPGRDPSLPLCRFRPASGVDKIITGFDPSTRKHRTIDGVWSEDETLYCIRSYDQNANLGQELITNGGMEASDGWAAYNTPTVFEYSTEQKKNGAKSLKFTVDAQFEGMTQSLTLAKGKSYLASAWVYGDGGSLHGYIGNTGYNYDYIVQATRVQAVWTQVKAVFTPTYDVVTFFRIYSSPGQTSGTWYADDVSVREIVGDHVYQSTAAQQPVKTWIAGQKYPALVFDGADDSLSAGDIGTIKTIVGKLKLGSTTEQIADMNGTASVSAVSGVLTATGWTDPALYVDGIPGSAIDTNIRTFAVASDTGGIAASAFAVGKIGSDYGAFSLFDLMCFDRRLAASEILTISESLKNG